mgnify:CR=1 FL=1
MKNRIFIVIILIFSTLIFSNNTIFAQDNAPTYQSLMLLGDQEFQKEEYIKAKTYYQEALRLKKNDATANNKLNKTLQKIREQGEKEEKFYEIIDIADNHYDNGEYEKSLAVYNKAKSLFPKDEYVKIRLWLNERYQNMSNRPFRDYSYSNIREFFADSVRYYYFKYWYYTIIILSINFLATKPSITIIWKWIRNK